jgi:endonuclease YncB( thermonuclease family)
MNRFIILLLLGFSASVIADINGKVVVVTDGDTIRVLDANRVQHKIRLAGIDAPERGQPFGNASRKYLASLVAGKAVRIESTKKDRYGRVLGKVWVQPRDCPSCGKTLNANHAQILAGMAWRYLDYVKDLSPEDRGRYESAEAEARKRKRGLWSEANAILAQGPEKFERKRGPGQFPMRLEAILPRDDFLQRGYFLPAQLWPVEARRRQRRFALLVDLPLTEIKGTDLTR